MGTPNIWKDIPWSAVLSLVVMLWAVGSLALIERLRRTFSTPQELQATEKRVCELIGGLENDFKEWRDSVKDQLKTTEARMASRGDLDGVGSRVNNLEHMFISTQKTAQEAKDASVATAAGLVQLTREVSQATSTSSQALTSINAVATQLGELRGEIRGYFQQNS